MEVRISHSKMKSEFCRILTKYGFTPFRADQCADIFMVNSLEGVYSHGVNRFHRFVDNIKDGYVKPDAEPSLVQGEGSFERWTGNLGPGPLNASFATDRAIELAHKNGIGLVTLCDTNHWMRGGTYGWQAARKGYIFIGWTNTEANMPAWGAKDPRLGNNPLVFAIPYNDLGIVLDFAMSQYSYGKMELYKIEDRQLPYPGGFRSDGGLTTDPGGILETRRPLPIGFWKGAGLSLILDILATVLSGGLSTHEITGLKVEHRLSQVFIAIDISRLSSFPAINDSIQKIIRNYKDSEPADEKASIRYPGENILKIRQENMKNGIPVNEEVWNRIMLL